MTSRWAGVAAACALLLGVVVLGTQLGGGEDEAAIASEECLRAWNSDPAAVSDGAHAFAEHRYDMTLIGRLDDRAQLHPVEADEGRCAVVFASETLDPEPLFGVRVLVDGRWAGAGVLGELTIPRIEELQREAVGIENASLLSDGTLALN